MRHRDRLCVVGAAPPEVRHWRFVWRGEASFTLPDGRCWTAHRVTGAGLRESSLSQGEITLTPRTGGERLRIATNRPRRSLKNLLQEGGVPAWERERLVIVRRDGVPVHVPGLGTEPDHAAAVDEAGWVFEPADPAGLSAS
jgi:tRNA(Ile)-lysidine synthase